MQWGGERTTMSVIPQVLSTFVLKHVLSLALEFRLDGWREGPRAPSVSLSPVLWLHSYTFLKMCFGYQTQILALHLIYWTIPFRPYISYFWLQTNDVKGQQLKLVFTICWESRGSKSSTPLLGSRAIIHLERKYFMCRSHSRTKTGQWGVLLRWLTHPSLAGHLSSLPHAPLCREQKHPLRIRS